MKEERTTGAPFLLGNAFFLRYAGVPERFLAVDDQRDFAIYRSAERNHVVGGVAFDLT